MTLRPHCPLCGGYLMPCTATATGEHPPLAALTASVRGWLALPPGEEEEQEGTSP